MFWKCPEIKHAMKCRTNVYPHRIKTNWWQFSHTVAGSQRAGRKGGRQAAVSQYVMWSTRRRDRYSISSASRANTTLPPNKQARQAWWDIRLTDYQYHEYQIYVVSGHPYLSKLIIIFPVVLTETVNELLRNVNKDNLETTRM